MSEASSFLEYLRNNTNPVLSSLSPESSTNSNVLMYDDRRVPFVELDTIMFGVFIFLFMVFGIFANLLTMLVIAKSKKLKSIFHYLIFSLCVSDLVSALVSWVNWYRRTLGFNDFRLPNVICVIYRSFDIWTSYATALHILSFAILRLISLRWPVTMNRIRSGYPVGVLWILFLWLFTFACGGVPFIIMNGVAVKDRKSTKPVSKWPACTALPEWFESYRSYTSIAFVFFFYIPLILTIILSIFIVTLMIRRRSKMKNHVSDAATEKQNMREKSAVYQLALIVISFIIGYVPFTAFEFITSMQHNDSFDNWWFDWHFGTVQYMCLRFSECLNPIFYNMSSRTMWKETKKFCFENLKCFRLGKENLQSFTVTKST